MLSLAVDRLLETTAIGRRHWALAQTLEVGVDGAPWTLRAQPLRQILDDRAENNAIVPLAGQRRTKQFLHPDGVLRMLDYWSPQPFGVVRVLVFRCFRNPLRGQRLQLGIAPLCIDLALAIGLELRLVAN